jgi:hypothetical protein
MKPLKLNGQLFRPQYSAAVERLEQYLDSLPDDEIVNGAALRNKEFGSNTISKAQAQLLAAGKCHPAPQQTFYGNKKAIAALKAMLARANSEN